MLKLCELDVLLDGTVHALFLSISLRMVQCSSGVYNSALSKVVLDLMEGNLYTIVRPNMVRVTFMHKHILKKFQGPTHYNICPKFNLAPFWRSSQ